MATPHEDFMDTISYAMRHHMDQIIMQTPMFDQLKPMLDKAKRITAVWHDELVVSHEPEEKMSLHTYRLRNGLRAVIDEKGIGVLENGQMKSWLPCPNDGHPKGGVMGNDFDAVVQIANNEKWTQLYNDAVTRRFEPGSVVYVPPEFYQYIPTQPQGEDNMAENRDGFVTIDYYDGYPIKDLSDDRIFDIIRDEQKKLNTLASVPEGAATSAHKARIEANIEKLMAAVNARHEDK